mgnify:CR=1 FL=1
MKPSSQIAILKTIVAWQADEIEALEKRLKEQDAMLTGSIEGLEDVELRVQIQTPEEHAWAKMVRAGQATATVPVRYEYDEDTGETRAYQNSGGKLELDSPELELTYD